MQWPRMHKGLAREIGELFASGQVEAALSRCEAAGVQESAPLQAMRGQCLVALGTPLPPSPRAVPAV